ncbi:hypothetical protein GH146_04995 [archaeon]|nr:hypothetical protein [archaeon]TET24609.1 MAG: hypothetical protein E3J73_07905 [Candidatus Bathyarchaeum sp.]
MNDLREKGSVWRRIMIMALLPLTIFLWMTGWTLYWIGDQRRSSRTTKKEAGNVFNKRDCERKNLKEVSPQQIFV